VHQNYKDLRKSIRFGSRFPITIALRMLHLTCIFIPVIITFPLYYARRDWWLNLLTYCIEASGPTFIKMLINVIIGDNGHPQDPICST
jgi:hypothetical protein